LPASWAHKKSYPQNFVPLQHVKIRMHLFRKYRSFSAVLILAVFLLFSGYSCNVSPINGMQAGNEKIRFTLSPVFSSEYILPHATNTQNIHVLPVLKCFPERVSFTETNKLLPVSFVSSTSGSFPNTAQIVLLEQICKLQI
jgi:hypothetical protein